MTMLTKNQIVSQNIISGADNPAQKDARGWRATSYDSRVGTIITSEGVLNSDQYNLPPRGIVWVVSAEDYKLPKTITGITTLKTGWTKKGVLTLTAGIVDPGYDGPISTAVINFSKTDFPIRKGDEFFRTVFFEHDDSKCKKHRVPRDMYVSKVLADKALSSSTFLTFEHFGNELVKKVFKMPAAAFWIGAVGVLLALAALVIPPITGMAEELMAKNVQIEVLKERVIDLESESRQRKSTHDQSVQRTEALEERLIAIESAMNSESRAND